ncbi:MFS general substrate transporter [Mycena pura]|uniref:MFS general substrate transporter n=1 Tax=Mycena pura TaxID=153505 RepID=A0AAD6V9M9_9AGAR|nr:MFS general substrate transporter [Mycena pura]
MSNTPQSQTLGIGDDPSQIIQEHDSGRPRWKSVLLVFTCTLAMITNLASSTAVPVFLPVIGADLNIPENQLQWIVSSFSLSSGCFLLLMGRLADLHGRKKFFILGTAWLVAFSIGCGFAQNPVTLYILRGLQGLGPASFIPACLGILAHAFPPSRARSIAFATFSAGAPIGGALGTQLGGVLSQYTKASWRAPFYLFAGLSALCAVGGALLIDPDLPSTEPDTRVDWLGALLVTSGLVLLVFVLGQGSLATQGWKTGYIIALLIVSIILLVMFLVWQYYLEQHEGTHRPPLMKLTLWSRAKGKFAVVQVIAFFEWAGFLSWYFWAQVYYEDYAKIPPVLTALRMLPMTVAGGLCNVFVVLVVSRVDLVYLIVFGTSFTALGALLFAVIQPSAPYWAYGFPSTIVAVFGGDFVFAAGTMFVAKVTLPHEQSLAGGIFQTLTQLGTSFGLGISTLVFNSLPGGMGDDAPLKAYQAAQWTAFGMAIVCSLLAALFLRGVGPVGIDERRRNPEVEHVADEKS